MTRSQFLLETIARCKANLAKPNVRYPNGRMSHDVEAEHLDRVTEEYEDYALEFGQFNAYGKLVSFAESN